ncbi:MAG: phosphohistidine phosphatase SixA [Inquilinus sp.]|nr:phosphohistidine phosphatase SixA [Inquilinus sp.]
MKLYLVQHGEAVAKEVDPERPLSDRGRQDVERLGRFLGDRGVRVSRVWHSGKTRARQTAERLAAAVAPGVEAEVRAGLAPNDPTEALAGTLGDGREDTMVVGHLPFMARLATRLVTTREDGPIVAYRPGSLVCLERDADGAWAVAWMLRPELLG